MRKVTEKCVKAFNENREVKSGNTIVSVETDYDDVTYVNMYLHGNCIAHKNLHTGEVSINNCGWESNTTKERLNGLIASIKGYKDTIYQKNWNWYWKEGESFPSNKWVTI